MIKTRKKFEISGTIQCSAEDVNTAIKWWKGNSDKSQVNDCSVEAGESMINGRM